MTPEGSTVQGSIADEMPEWAQIDASRIGHVERVAALLAAWADEMRVTDCEKLRWHKAAVLHDSLKDAPDGLLDELTSGWGIVAVRHGYAAANQAERHGERDIGVLDAVRYHSVGYAGWETVGKVLFLADYLEAGRDYHTVAHGRLSARVPTELGDILRIVTAERLSAILAHGFPLLKETVEFWNALVIEQ